VGKKNWRKRRILAKRVKRKGKDRKIEVNKKSFITKGKQLSK
jgi:hypothetical protein